MTAHHRIPLDLVAALKSAGVGDDLADALAAYATEARSVDRMALTYPQAHAEAEAHLAEGRARARDLIAEAADWLRDASREAYSARTAGW